MKAIKDHTRKTLISQPSGTLPQGPRSVHLFIGGGVLYSEVVVDRLTKSLDLEFPIIMSDCMLLSSGKGRYHRAYRRQTVSRVTKSDRSLQLLSNGKLFSYFRLLHIPVNAISSVLLQYYDRFSLTHFYLIILHFTRHEVGMCIQIPQFHVVNETEISAALALYRRRVLTPVKVVYSERATSSQQRLHLPSVCTASTSNICGGLRLMGFWMFSQYNTVLNCIHIEILMLYNRPFVSSEIKR
ncbi:hypothetical protein J6590_041847 [Homalodisca vitripennis]|nr:hypothetical protein J6590_041847 [Homalodisca vitripennis]